MKNIIAVCTKELYTYFVSPIAYFVCFVFTAISGFLFSILLLSTSNYGGSGADVMNTLFGNMAVILLFFTPVLTMKLFAEERKSGTIELLLTSPITDGQVVLGKFFASWTLLLMMLGLTLFFPFLAQRFGPVDAGPLLSGYLGLLLIGSAFLSLGLLMSSMSKKPTRCGPDRLRIAHHIMGNRRVIHSCWCNREILKLSFTAGTLLRFRARCHRSQTRCLLRQFYVRLLVRDVQIG